MKNARARVVVKVKEIMGLAQTVPVYTIEEYLAMERESVERHEYIDGEIFVMAGETDPHSIITINLGAEFHNQLKGRDCAALSPNMKVRSGPDPKFSRSLKGFFSYADLMRTPRSRSCVTSSPGKPQGLMRLNGVRSMSTFRLSP